MLPVQLFSFIRLNCLYAIITFINKAINIRNPVLLSIHKCAVVETNIIISNNMKITAVIESAL